MTLSTDEYVKYLDIVTTFVAEYTFNVIGAIIIFLVGKWAARKISNGIERLMERAEIDETLNDLTGSVIYFGLLVVVIMMALETLGVKTTSFLAVLGAAGLAVGLALKDTLSNIGAAVIILIFRPFKVGDYIGAGGAEGFVDKISLFTTTISPFDNRTIIVPNSAVTAGNIINFSNKEQRRVDHVVGISYGDDIKKAKEVMYRVIADEPRTLEDPAPLVAVKELGESSVNFTVRAWVKSEEYWPVYFDLIENIKLALDANDITIPFPQMDVHLSKEG